MELARCFLCPWSLCGVGCHASSSAGESFRSATGIMVGSCQGYCGGHISLVSAASLGALLENGQRSVREVQTGHTSFWGNFLRFCALREIVQQDAPNHVSMGNNASASASTSTLGLTLGRACFDAARRRQADRRHSASRERSQGFTYTGFRVPAKCESAAHRFAAGLV